VCIIIEQVEPILPSFLPGGLHCSTYLYYICSVFCKNSVCKQSERWN